MYTYAYNLQQTLYEIHLMRINSAVAGTSPVCSGLKSGWKNIHPFASVKKLGCFQSLGSYS